MSTDEVTYSVDFDPDRWVAIDTRGMEPDEWALAQAQVSFDDAGEPDDEDGIRLLASALLTIHDQVEEMSDRLEIDYTAYVHMPTPSRPGAIALTAVVFSDEGTLDAQDVAEYAGANDPDVAEPPRVEPFTSQLGEGVRVRRFMVTEERRGLRRHRTVSLSYTYAWPVLDGEALVRLHVGGEDIALVEAAAADADALARAISLS